MARWGVLTNTFILCLPLGHAPMPDSRLFRRKLILLTYLLPSVNQLRYRKQEPVYGTPPSAAVPDFTYHCPKKNTTYCPPTRIAKFGNLSASP
ncbi:hypothetical protein L873DRAFT_1799482 [Choiromyces venosus 120613-1]|uniref:Secreted protein n=1 Tax=Choiromyces venosus 120613-1 TaxID=1336337 RepID=A0A3N4K2K7_9PEZI|nr:hypothetical protein L873DRAFT_1799482 [Choiromyces venosus 120613-1]